MRLRDFRGCSELKEQTEFLRRRIAALRSAAERAGSGIYTVHSGGRKSSRIEADVEKIEELEALLQQKLDKYTALALEYEYIFQKMAGTPEGDYVARALTYKYLDMMSWTQAAVKMHTTPDSLRIYCERYVKNIEFKG